jgi:type IV pilus biogenesis protein PilP
VLLLPFSAAVAAEEGSDKEYAPLSIECGPPPEGRVATFQDLGRLRRLQECYDALTNLRKARKQALEQQEAIRKLGESEKSGKADSPGASGGGPGSPGQGPSLPAPALFGGAGGTPAASPPPQGGSPPAKPEKESPAAEEEEKSSDEQEGASVSPDLPQVSQVLGAGDQARATLVWPNGSDQVRRIQVRPGDSLPEGGQVQKVSASSVVVEIDGERHRLAFRHGMGATSASMGASGAQQRGPGLPGRDSAAPGPGPRPVPEPPPEER